MHVEWYNHVPLARRIARDVDVRWGEHRGIAKTIEELKRRSGKRVGLIGPLAYKKLKELEKEFEVVPLDAEYVRLRLIKSEEEIEWLRIGAALSDAGFHALLEGTRPGLTERNLANLVEGAYVGQGGTTLIHYIGVTSMADPQLCVPPQYASSRRVSKGDVVFCELSAYWWDYPGQVLRSFTVGAEPTPLYLALHDTAEAAFDSVTSVIKAGTTMQEIIDAAGVIEERGFTVYDDLMHGFGGGYFPPILGTRSRPAGTLPQMTLEQNMTVVVQPNVITPDQKAGVQVGELIRVTEHGFERLHTAPRGFFRVDGSGRALLPDGIV
jgi:Xaa-Pro dipeptidase